MNKRNLKMTYTDGALTRIELPNGYVSPKGIRYYIKDYQGNIRQVVDSVGTVLQENHYYPFGTLMGESSDIIEANRFGRWADSAYTPYRYSGNRLLTPGNAHIGDFNARWYDFQTCRFITPDEHREKYYQLNSYLYCTNECIPKDAFVSHHTWHINPNADPDDSKTVKEMDIFEIRGDECAKNLFEFFANLIGLEYSWFKTGIEGEKGLNFITTSKKRTTDVSASILFNYQLSGGYTIREYIHHPDIIEENMKLV